MHTETIFLFVGVFYLISFLALFRYYKILRTSEYLLASIIFLALFINGIMINFFGGVGTLYELIPVLTAIFLLLIVTKNVLGASYNTFYYTILAMMGFLAVLNLITITFTEPIFHLIQIVEFETVRFLVGCYLFYSYRNIEIFIENRRTRITRYSWMIAGCIAILTSTIRIVSIISYIYQTPVQQLAVDAPVLYNSLLLVSVGALLLSIITGIIAIFFPEVFIMSRQQVSRLDDLYELSDLVSAEHVLSSLFPDHVLIDYLETVADEIARIYGRQNDEELDDS